MPHNRIVTCRALRRCRIASSASRVTCGFNPRSMSLAPSSTMTAPVPCGTDQSRRARPSAAVSPDTPALAMSAATPSAASAACSRGTKLSLAGRPRPAVSESPSTTTLTGVSAPAGPAAVATIKATLQAANTPANWTSARRHPYEERAQGSIERMNDISGSSSAGDAVMLNGVNLSLGRGAARVHILRDISLHIGRGEAVALLGPSGSGKSTLLMVMTGLERPDSGAVVVAGQDLRKLDEDALARFRGKQIGIVFQAFHLIPTMTALENVATPLELSGAHDALKRAASELAAVGLGQRLQHYPAELSGGEQQRVALARALAADPAIIVADEPTGNLDETTGHEIIELLFRGHRERGTTLVLVTHVSELA